MIVCSLRDVQLSANGTGVCHYVIFYVIKFVCVVSVHSLIFFLIFFLKIDFSLIWYLI